MIGSGIHERHAERSIEQALSDLWEKWNGMTGAQRERQPWVWRMIVGLDLELAQRADNTRAS